MDAFDQQVETIMKGLYGDRARFSDWGSFADVEGVGLYVGNRFHPSRQVRISVWVASSVPVGTPLLDVMSDLNSRLHFGALTTLGEQDKRWVQLYYDFMRPWLDGMTPNSHGVAQPLLDLVGNLPILGREVQQVITSNVGGQAPDLTDGWDFFFTFLGPAGPLEG